MRMRRLPTILNGESNRALWKTGHNMIGRFGNVRQALLFKDLQT